MHEWTIDVNGQTIYVLNLIFGFGMLGWIVLCAWIVEGGLSRLIDETKRNKK